MKHYREIKRPALSVLDEIPGSTTRRVVIHGSMASAERNQSRFYRLNPVVGWSVTRRRTLIGLLSRAPADHDHAFERVAGGV